MLDDIQKRIDDLKKRWPAHSVPAAMVEELDELEHALDMEKKRLEFERIRPDKPFQDYYPDPWAVCYGCGRLNEHGHQIKSHWDESGEYTIAHFKPKPYHTAIEGYVYGGLLASLIDCHGTGTAAAAAYRAAGREMDTEPPFRYLTASLHVNYHKPTPLGVELTLKGKIKELKGRKVIVEIDLIAEGSVCVSGEVVAVEVPEKFLEQLIEE